MTEQAQEEGQAQEENAQPSQLEEGKLHAPNFVSKARKCTFWAERCEVVNAPDIPDEDKCRWYVKVKGQQVGALNIVKQVEFDMCEFDAILLAAQRPVVIQSGQGARPGPGGGPQRMQ